MGFIWIVWCKPKATNTLIRIKYKPPDYSSPTQISLSSSLYKYKWLYLKGNEPSQFIACMAPYTCHYPILSLWISHRTFYKCRASHFADGNIKLLLLVYFQEWGVSINKIGWELIQISNQHWSLKIRSISCEQFNLQSVSFPLAFFNV